MTDPPAARATRLPAEWEPQWATLLLWPTETSHWQPVLRYAQQTYLTIMTAIRRFQQVIICVPDDELIEADLWASVEGLFPIQVITAAYDDTWIRDCGPLTLIGANGPYWADFRFSGWGGRRCRPLSDALVAALGRRALFRHLSCERHQWALEGGAIESDGAGTLLTTSRCIRHRFVQFDRSRIEELFAAHLGAQRVLWLDHGELLGDETDGSVDMLARFADARTIVYQGCARPADPHFPFLAAMAAQLGTFRTHEGSPYRLLELPLPHTMGDTDCRVPASYANFLILNRAVLIPTYDDPENDARAAAVLQQAFPDRCIVPVDCRILITQGRGIHGAAMQLPAGAAGNVAAGCT